MAINKENLNLPVIHAKLQWSQCNKIKWKWKHELLETIYEICKKHTHKIPLQYIFKCSSFYIEINFPKWLKVRKLDELGSRVEEVVSCINDYLAGITLYIWSQSFLANAIWLFHWNNLQFILEARWLLHELVLLADFFQCLTVKTSGVSLVLSMYLWWISTISYFCKFMTFILSAYIFKHFLSQRNFFSDNMFWSSALLMCIFSAGQVFICEIMS